MKTIILPGFSIKNKEWANDVKDNLDGNAVIHEWKHWQTGENKDFDIQKECEVIKTLVSKDLVQIIAKSIGTFIAVSLLPDIHDKINKLILCGIPVKDLTKEELDVYDNLMIPDPNKITVFQNKDDNHGSLAQAKELLKNIKVEIVAKPRDDHHYPYYDDFKAFLG